MSQTKNQKLQAVDNSIDLKFQALMAVLIESGHLNDRAYRAKLKALQDRAREDIVAGS